MSLAVAWLVTWIVKPHIQQVGSSFQDTAWWYKMERPIHVWKCKRSESRFAFFQLSAFWRVHSHSVRSCVDQLHVPSSLQAVRHLRGVIVSVPPFWPLICHQYVLTHCVLYLCFLAFTHAICGIAVTRINEFALPCFFHLINYNHWNSIVHALIVSGLLLDMVALYPPPRNFLLTLLPLKGLPMHSCALESSDIGRRGQDVISSIPYLNNMFGKWLPINWAGLLHCWVRQPFHNS